MNKTRVFFACFLLLFLSCSVDAGEKKETKRIDKPKIIKKIDTVDTVKQELIAEEIKGQNNARVIIGLKVKALQWEKMFYEQKAIAIQQNFLIKCWGDSEFQEVQRIGKKTDKELKRLLILQ